MEQTELRGMRLKQVAVTNGLMVTAIVTLTIIMNIFTIQATHFSFFLGMLVLLQGIFGLIRRDSTKSIIPIFKKVANYEKHKMGSEWYKQRKVSYVWNLLLSCLLFFQSYSNRHSPDNVFQVEVMIMFMMTFFLLLVINLSLLIHFRKVDRSTSELDMKGFTWKSNLMGIAIGIVFALITFVMAIFYAISGI